MHAKGDTAHYTVHTAHHCVARLPLHAHFSRMFLNDRVVRRAIAAAAGALHFGDINLRSPLGYSFECSSGK